MNMYTHTHKHAHTHLAEKDIKIFYFILKAEGRLTSNTKMTQPCILSNSKPVLCKALLSDKVYKKTKQRKKKPTYTDTDNNNNKPRHRLKDDDNNNNNEHLSCAHQRPERSYDT